LVYLREAASHLRANETIQVGTMAQLQIFGSIRQHSATVDAGVLFIYEMCRAAAAVIWRDKSEMNYVCR